MKKINIFFLFLIVACSSTKITKYTALPRIIEGEGILMMNIRNLPETQQIKLFQFGRKIISESNEMRFIPELEYDLASIGINREQLYRNTIPDSVISTITAKANSRYILYVENLSSKKGETFGSYTPLELNKYNSPYYQESETNSAILLFRIVDIDDKLTESRFQISSKISPLIINEDDGGETRVNLTTDFTAITKAFEKGMKQLKKGVLNK